VGLRLSSIALLLLLDLVRDFMEYSPLSVVDVGQCKRDFSISLLKSFEMVRVFPGTSSVSSSVSEGVTNTLNGVGGAINPGLQTSEW